MRMNQASSGPVINLT